MSSFLRHRQWICVSLVALTGGLAFSAPGEVCVDLVDPNGALLPGERVEFQKVDDRSDPAKLVDVVTNGLPRVCTQLPSGKYRANVVRSEVLRGELYTYFPVGGGYSGTLSILPRIRAGIALTMDGDKRLPESDIHTSEFGVPGQPLPIVCVYESIRTQGEVTDLENAPSGTRCSLGMSSVKAGRIRIDKVARMLVAEGASIQLAGVRDQPGTEIVRGVLKTVTLEITSGGFLLRQIGRR